MLEILFLRFIVKQLGNIAKQKGHNSSHYKRLAVILWFSGELLGFIGGAIIVGNNELAISFICLFAILGAAVGYSIAYLIVNNLPQLESNPLLESKSPWRDR